MQDPEKLRRIARDILADVDRRNAREVPLKNGDVVWVRASVAGGTGSDGVVMMLVDEGRGGRFASVELHQEDEGKLWRRT